MPVNIDDIQKLVDAQNRWRGKETINLIASENMQSDAVKQIQCSDFMSRYAEGHPNEPGVVNRYYQGTKYIDEIEVMARKEMCELMKCRLADIRPISGNQANTAVALGYLRAGDAVIVNSTDAGGHISHNPYGVFGRRIQMRGQSLKSGAENAVPVHFWPLTEDQWHIDVEKAIELIDKVQPRLCVFGKSVFLFPDPVKEVAPICKEKGIPILYDAAHVLGLIAGGQFQDPLREGATWITASTHKTFPGPQRGVILSDVSEEDEATYWNPADRGVFPGSSSNHHLHTLPALLVSIREMKAHAAAYAEQTVKNAKALGAALDEAGVPVAAREFGYTACHLIAVDVRKYCSGVEAAIRLENNDIIVNYNMLPGDQDARNPSGLRIGVPEVTRLGMTEPDMQTLAALIADAIQGKDVKAEVAKLRGRFAEMKFC